MKALDIDRNYAPAWYSLKVLGGVRVGAENFTHADCYCIALRIDRKNVPAWYSLGILGSGRVGTDKFCLAAPSVALVLWLEQRARFLAASNAECVSALIVFLSSAACSQLVTELGHAMVGSTSIFISACVLLL
jgi:hypothetical protein